MAKWNHIALPLVMVVLGVLLVIGSVLSIVGTTFFPLDQFVGTRGSVAGIAFGIGILAAAAAPEEHPSWVRAGVVYCGLEAVYEIVAWIWLGSGGFAIVPFVLSILIGFLLIFLYPRRQALVPARAV